MSLYSLDLMILYVFALGLSLRSLYKIDTLQPCFAEFADMLAEVGILLTSTTLWRFIIVIQDNNCITELPITCLVW